MTAPSSSTRFEVGTMYSVSDIQSGLNVGNAGGVRFRLSDKKEVMRLVVMTAVSSAKVERENPYHDRMEQDILVYTGAGKEGDQTLAGVNKRIPQQQDRIFPIYGFRQAKSRRDKSIGPNRWEFIGLLEYLRHYPETQFDSRSLARQVWLFELRVHPVAMVVQDESEIAARLIEKSRDLARINGDDREVVGGPISEDANAAEHARAIEAIRSRLLTLDPERFEHLVKSALIATGFDKVAVTRFSQDGGVDVHAIAGPTMWPIRGLSIQIQAKRWLHTVGRKEIAELRGSMQPFARGAVVTTSHFSRAAIKEACEEGKLPIVLLDGYRFASLLRPHQRILDEFGLVP